MNLFEFFEPTPQGYQDLEDDNSQPQIHDLRKTKLTLKQINKLRQLNDVRTYEYQENIKQVKKQYAPPAQPAL
jgi:hypothetical protein